MCRLVAYLGPAIPVGRTLYGGRHSLERQAWAPRELLSGSVNADGFGVVWYPDGERPVRLARDEPVWYDPDLRGLLGSVRAPVALAALRNATPGLPVDRAGLLPLVRDDWSFILNGYLPDFRERHMRALRDGLPDARYGQLEGVSDAETLFLRVLAEIDAGSPPPDALDRVARAVAERLDPGERAPLTMVLARSEGWWVLNTAVGGGACNSLYVAEDPALAPGGVLLASERLDTDPAWTGVPPHGRVAVDRRGLRVTGGAPPVG